MSEEIIERKPVLKGDYSLTQFCGPNYLDDRVCLQLTVAEAPEPGVSFFPGISYCSLTKVQVEALRADLDAWLTTREPALLTPEAVEGELVARLVKRIADDVEAEREGVTLYFEETDRVLMRDCLAALATSGVERELIGRLVDGIRWWAAQEDGIPQEVCKAFNDAMGYLRWEYSTQVDIAALTKEPAKPDDSECRPEDYISHKKPEPAPDSPVDVGEDAVKELQWLLEWHMGECRGRGANACIDALALIESLAKELTESRAENALLKAEVDGLHFDLRLAATLADKRRVAGIRFACGCDWDKVKNLFPDLPDYYESLATPEPPVKQGEEKP